MAELHASKPEHEGITALALDGSPILLNTLSELYILQEAAGRWAFSKGLDLAGEDVRPIDMFDIIGGTDLGGFYTVLFVSLKMTIGQAIQSHGILERRLFRSDVWNNKIQQACIETLNSALDEIVKVLEIATSLDSPYEVKNSQTKCFVCTINPAAAGCCRLLRNYRPRTGQGPVCTVRQVLRATLSNHVQLPPVRIGEERFLSGLNGYPNPTHVLMKELCNAFVKGTQVACLANVGAGDLSTQILGKQKDMEELTGLFRSCQLVADDVATQCHDLGSFFFRFSVPLGLEQKSCSPDNDVSRVVGLTMAYHSTNEISTQLDNLEEKLREHFGVVVIERLNSISGKDGESRVAARLAKVEEHLNDTIFQDVKSWLQPIHQTSKLDSNIRARSKTTCRWLLENDIFLRWMEKRGLFWLRGLMGTGKTVMSSFVVETLLAREDVYVAYYYFEFTNPTTLSEEALFRSLVCQLSGAAPGVVRALYQKHNKGGLQPQLATLQATLNELVTVSAKPVFLIIDALDEFPIPQRKYLLQSLMTFSASKSASRTHVIVTSREEVDIHRVFKGEVDFELVVQGDLVRQDIAAFIDRELEVTKWTFWPRDAIAMARRLLNERADGQFRMATCQVDILRQARTYEQLKQCLHSLPRTLRETYDYILQNIPEHLRHQAHRLFTILSVALESIYIDELSALLAVELGDEDDSTQHPQFQENNRFVDDLDVVELGGSLVSRGDRYRDNTLQLAHASVKEHFLTLGESWFSLHENLAHSMTARACIALLVHFQTFQKEHLEDGYTFSYATRNWSQHVLPNGPPQLLRQQEYIYASFPWPYLLNALEGMSSSLASAAFLGLIDLVTAFLNGCFWMEVDLANALAAALKSKRAKPIRMQCLYAILAYGVDVNTFADIGTPLHHASEVGDLEFMQVLIEMGADVNAGEEFDGSVLQAGARSGKLEVVRFLVDKGADVNTRGGRYGSALHAGAYFRGELDVVCFLVEQGADVNASGGEYGSALQVAAYWGNLEIVRFLIENGADVNACGGENGSALHAAICAITGSVEIVRLLVESGADVNADGGHNGSQLLSACRIGGGKPEIARFLIENGADLNAGGGEQDSALCNGAWSGNLEIVRLLVENGADVNACGEYYGSALQAGASGGNLEIVRLLVEKGANVNTGGGHYGSALQAASCAIREKLELVHFLVEEGADVNAGGGKYGSALQAGAYSGNLEIVRFLVEKGADVNVAGGEYGSALQAASHTYSDLQSLEVVRFLVGNGADVNAGGGRYGSALQAGAAAGNLSTIRFLIEHGADVNVGGGQFGSALQAASRPYGGSLEVVRVLVEEGADVNAGGGEYGSALQAGACDGKLDVIRFLVEKGADINQGGGEYGSALQASTYKGHLDIVRFLVEHGADLNVGGGKYGSALQAGIRKGKLDIVRFLVANGVNVNMSGGKYGSALQAAAYNGRLWAVRLLVENGANIGKLEIVQFLVEKGADENAGSEDRGSALQAGVISGKLEIVRFLFEYGADINASGGLYNSALQTAALHKKLKLIRFLVVNGADVNVSGGEYGSALQAVAMRGELEVVRFLVVNGADVNASGGSHGSALHAAELFGRLKVVRFLVENGADLNAVGGRCETPFDVALDPFDVEMPPKWLKIGRILNSRGARTSRAPQYLLAEPAEPSRIARRRVFGPLVFAIQHRETGIVAEHRLVNPTSTRTWALVIHVPQLPSPIQETT
ncbi:ankyrin repeat-containing domain protein [Flagelloscypha sp. PMI_526]|nr:ankyrin repeat-containing domain protein [Flagelloscypha sp. PMI_526]